MKLNPDCVRDVLLSFESITDGRTTFIYRKWEGLWEEFPLLQKYSIEELVYHVRQCDLSGLLYKVSISPFDGFTIIDITPSAHEFLANIRLETNWHKTKEILSKTGTFALSSIKSVAEGVATAAIKSQLNL